MPVIQRRLYKIRKKRRKKRKGRLRVSKTTKKLLNKMISRKMDDNVEDLFKISSYTNHISQYDAVNRDMLMELSPNLALGTSQSERIGTRVRMKSLTIQLRLLPKQYSHVYQTATAPVVTATVNAFRQQPTIKVFIVQMIRDVAGQPLNMLRLALRDKYRPPGLWRQEVEQSAGQIYVKGMKVLSKTTMKAKYKYVSSPVTPGSIESQTTVSVPQYSFKQLYCAINKKLLIENTSGNPQRISYFLYIQFGSNYQNYTYDPVDVPQIMESRERWVYEDA